MVVIAGASSPAKREFTEQTKAISSDQHRSTYSVLIPAQAGLARIQDQRLLTSDMREHSRSGLSLWMCGLTGIGCSFSCWCIRR